MGRKDGRPEFAIIGLGRFGRSVAFHLMERGYTVLGIDRDPQIVQQLADDMPHIVALDSTDEDALRAVDIASFDTVVVAIGTHFENNLLTTAALKSIGVRRVLCKGLNERQQQILLRVGADEVVLPEHEAGERLAVRLASPMLLDHLNLGKGFSAAEIQVPAALLGKSLGESSLRNAYGVSLLAIRRGDELMVIPPAETIFQPEDMLLVVGSEGSINTFCVNV